MRTNQQIRVPNVRLFDEDSKEALGIVPIGTAMTLAKERDMDLVEVAPQADPPVCRIMDYGKYRFEALKKERESKRDHMVSQLKEIKLRPKISDHDLHTKIDAAMHFLEEGHKVKVTVTFRGRELAHQEFGSQLLTKVQEQVVEVAVIDKNPLMEGKNLTMILSPVAKKAPKK